MIHLLIDGSNNSYGWIILLVIFLAVGLPSILLILAIAVRSKRKRASNVLFIITAVYAIIGLGMCGSLML